MYQDIRGRDRQIKGFFLTVVLIFEFGKILNLEIDSDMKFIQYLILVSIIFIVFHGFIMLLLIGRLWLMFVLIGHLLFKFFFDWLLLLKFALIGL